MCRTGPSLSAFCFVRRVLGLSPRADEKRVGCNSWFESPLVGLVGLNCELSDERLLSKESTGPGDGLVQTSPPARR